MKETIYIKKYIKTVDDLPKDFKNYFICKRNGVINTWTRFPYDDDDWIKRVDWYLQEVELPTDEEIQQSFSDPGDDNYERWSINAATWMREEILKRNT